MELTRECPMPDADFASELRFWDRELSLKGDYADDILCRLDRDKSEAVFPKYILPYFQSLDSECISVLDVGSGPLSMLTWGTRLFKLVCADPLADAYKELHRKYGYKIEYDIVSVTGEKLYEKFEKETFDVVWSNNALDHSQVPSVMFSEMVNATKKNGYIIVSGSTKEGTRWSFNGLHKHDIYFYEGHLKCESLCDSNNLSKPIILDALPNIVIENTPKESLTISNWWSVVYRKIA